MIATVTVLIESRRKRTIVARENLNWQCAMRLPKQHRESLRAMPH